MKMETKTITLLGKELTISTSYESFRNGFREQNETIDIERLVDLVGDEGSAKQLAEEMVEYVYNKVYSECAEASKAGDALYSYHNLHIHIGEGGLITATAVYSECNDYSLVEFYVYDKDMKKDEEDEDGEEIEENVRHNEIVEALCSEEFRRKMDEDNLADFEQLEDEERENYKRLHPEEFDEE